MITQELQVRNILIPGNCAALKQKTRSKNTARTTDLGCDISEIKSLSRYNKAASLIPNKNEIRLTILLPKQLYLRRCTP
jgi:hypothetical protein